MTVQESVQALVVAKAPEPGRAKTRLGAEIGMTEAAEVAAASLLDTLAACADAFGAGRCHLAMAGDLTRAVQGREISRALSGWTVFPQRGEGLGARLVSAHADLAARTEGAVVQIGMDTPQVTPDHLTEVATSLQGPAVDAVLGPATDGGWWVLALRDPRAARPLATVAMSTSRTFLETRSALEASGLRVGDTASLQDVDTVTDAVMVARQAPDGLFARAWEKHGPICWPP